MKCPYCNFEIEITLAKVPATLATPPPVVVPSTELNPGKNPTTLIEVPTSGIGYIRDLKYECYLQRRVWKILEYGFLKSSRTDRLPVILLAGSRKDGSAPVSNPEHTGGRSFDSCYPIVANGNINYNHLYELLAAWNRARNELYPKADIKIKMFKEYVFRLYELYDVIDLNIRLIGDEDDPNSDRDHREHMHINIMGVR